MATFKFFDEFGSDLGKGKHALDTHQMKIALVSEAAGIDHSTMTVFTNITEITTYNGYTTGGVALTGESWTESTAGAGNWKFWSNDLTLTATSGGIGPFRYVVLFNDDQTSPAKPLIGWLDYTTNVTIASGNTFLIDVGDSGWFQIPITS